ncbi:Gfo/Idh/MocA family protein [Brevundimonas sp. UBA7664]|uniref:Gfo/Idh/MocA family protein n=1 Tax=Brevundimonas sp. UBA7664 TaxID=1946141 RepID=UPI0025C45CB1|nr:Gfo/Idh/MocA family oxidoreductase [Brevundimonas sp. UBA7664]
MNRRDLIAAAAATGGALALPTPTVASSRASGRLRLGMIGVGMRGRVLLRELVRRDDVEVAGLCDIDAFTLNEALKQFTEAGKPAPRLYTGSNEAWREMLASADLDGVIIATPWELHAPMAIAAMRARVPVACEVVAGITLDDHWRVLRTQLETGTPYMLLENVCFRRDVMAVLNMVRQGVFGEMIHLEGGYQHDLRAVKFNAGVPGEAYGGGVEFGARGWSEARWRTPHSVDRNGDLYPSHGIGPCAMWANINRGNRFTRLTSYASKARGLHNHVVAEGGADHPNARVNFRLGDVVQTMIGCENGETVMLSHDTNLPRPYSLGFRVQGEKGLWMDLNRSIYVEGQSPQPHRWEEAQAWLDRYDHPLWQAHAADAEGAGHGGMDFFVIHAFVEALKAQAPMPIDIFDAVTWSAVTPLSETSIAEGNRTIDFPDFTEGGWRDRAPIFAV